MIQTDGRNVFRGIMRITNPIAGQHEEYGEWTYDHEHDRWHRVVAKGITSSYPAKMCKVVEDETA